MGNVTDRQTCDATEYTADDVLGNNISEFSEQFLEVRNGAEGEVEKEVQVEVVVGESVRSNAWMGEEVLSVLLYMLRGTLDDRIVSTLFCTLCKMFIILSVYFKSKFCLL